MSVFCYYTLLPLLTANALPFLPVSPFLQVTRPSGMELRHKNVPMPTKEKQRKWLSLEADQAAAISKAA